jgi:hypothetical protein
LQLTPLAAHRGRPKLHASGADRSKAFRDRNRDEVRVATALRVRAHREKMASEERDKAISDQKADDKVANQQTTADLLRRTIRRLKSELSDAQERLDQAQEKAGDGKYEVLETLALVILFFFFFFFFFFGDGAPTSTPRRSGGCCVLVGFLVPV